ncbi:MAG: DNA-binding protein [Candidatus Aenigmatarchaeota archaeon]|nr:MAG: DNA-binding protein [Candidatus Aenigmarchaeota archaeon]
MEEVKAWLEKAEEDLVTAKVNLENKRYDAAAFFAHQAAEKALKALYILRFKKLWKTHDLVALLVKLKGGKRLLRFCDELNRHYIETRYPTGAEYTERIAAKAVRMAERVVRWVKRSVKE